MPKYKVKLEREATVTYALELTVDARDEEQASSKAKEEAKSLLWEESHVEPGGTSCVVTPAGWGDEEDW